MQHATAYDLTGKTAVVTGSSTGIGNAIALEFAGAGANVLVCANRSVEKANLTAKIICSMGVESKVVLVDLAEAKGRSDLIDQAWSWRDIDIWVNNAGADILTAECADWSFDQKIEQLWKVDVSATLALSRQVGTRMRDRGSGVILNMGWDQAELGMAGESGEIFAAVKGAIMAFTRSVAKSLAPEVRVNCLAPGWIHTQWLEEASDYWQQRAQRESLVARWGEPQDVARVARFLCSPASSFLNGQIIPVNGGLRTSFE